MRRHIHGTAVHYYSDRLQRKMKLLDKSRAAIIEAPSGYGKTTIMRDYIEDAAKRGEDTYWFTAVDEAPTVLYQRLCHEIEKIDSRAGGRLIEIDLPNAFTIWEVCETVKSIECDHVTWLVIDDFHFCCAALPPPFLAALLDHGGDALRIVILAQSFSQYFLAAAASHGIPHIMASSLKWDAEDIYQYFQLVGTEITKSAALEVKEYTDGWIFTVYLQLCSYYEEGVFCDEAVSQLMEHFIWDKMTAEQQDFFMRLSTFESFTVERMCGILGCDELPGYAMDSLSLPFICYIPEQRRYEPHAILLELVKIKRREQGAAYETDCLMKAGDICRSEGKMAEALGYYAQIKDYGRILTLELSRLVCVEFGNNTFYNVALEISANCPAGIRRKYPLSMLCVAWALRLSENEEAFGKLMDELNGSLPEDGPLRAEWLLLSAYLHYPNLKKMLPIVRKAAVLFDGACSKVILPEAPWAFYEYLQLPTFHIRVGAADEEAEILEDFISVYSRLTGGHGAGAGSLFCAELAFFRCETAKAEIFAHKAVFLAESKQQKIIQIGAIRVLASIAVLKADLDGWQRVVDAMGHASAGSAQNTIIFRMMLDVVRGSLLAQLKEYDRFAKWLKNANFMSLGLPTAIHQKAVTVHGYYLMGHSEYARLIGLLQTIPLEKYNAFPEYYHFFIMAVCYSSLGDIPQTIACLERSVQKALPDGMLYCYASFSRLLQGLSDKIIKDQYPHLHNRFIEYEEQYTASWRTLQNKDAAQDPPTSLTGREHEIAKLAANGLRNNEIAKMLFVSEHTVRAHLRAIYQKLDIDRRARLAQKLEGTLSDGSLVFPDSTRLAKLAQKLK